MAVVFKVNKSKYKIDSNQGLSKTINIANNYCYNVIRLLDEETDYSTASTIQKLNNKKPHGYTATDSTTVVCIAIKLCCLICENKL